MKHNLSLLLALVGGIGIGISGISPAWLHNTSLPMIVLSALIIQVGIGVGAMHDLGTMLRSINLKMFLLPACTIVGTLLFTALAFLIFSNHHLSDIMAIGNGFGYYSLSSVLIAQMKTITVGATEATQLATIALLANIARELLSLFGCRYIAHKGGGLAAISAAGISSMDVCLPSILNAIGDKRVIPVAVFHGLMLEMSIPMLIALFCT